MNDTWGGVGRGGVWCGPIRWRTTDLEVEENSGNRTNGHLLVEDFAMLLSRAKAGTMKGGKTRRLSICRGVANKKKEGSSQERDGIPVPGRQKIFGERKGGGAGLHVEVLPIK